MSALMKEIGAIQTDMVCMEGMLEALAKIIDIPADDAVSSGFSYGITDTEMVKFINKSLEELDFEEQAATAIKWSRLYGGALMVMLVDDGKDLCEPVDWDNIRGIDELLVFERPLVSPDYHSIYNYKPNPDKPEKFFCISSTFQVQ